MIELDCVLHKSFILWCYLVKGFDFTQKGFYITPNIVNLCVMYYMWSSLLILADRSTFTCVLSCATIRNTNVWRLIYVVKLSIMKFSGLITYWLYNYLLLLIQMKHANLGLQLMKYSITWYSIQNWLLSISLCLNTLLA